MRFVFGTLLFVTAFAVSVLTGPPGCAGVEKHGRIIGNIAQRPGLVEATWAVWREYGHDDLPPAVSVVEPPYLDCADGRGFTWPTLGCVYGVTTSPWTCAVAYTGTKWSETSLPHELYHAHQWTTGVIDLKHVGPGWEPGGSVDKARFVLVQHDL